MLKSVARILAGAAALALAPAAANAAVVVNITQAAGNVLVDTSGSIDLTGLTSQGTYSLDLGLSPKIGYVSGGTGGDVTAYSGFAGPTSIGTGSYLDATTSTGTMFAFNAASFGNPLVFLPQNYTTGAAIAASQSYANATLASLGLTAGSYLFKSAADTVTINVGQAGAVPELASWAMMILGMGAVGAAMRRQVRRSDAKFDARIKRIAAGELA